MQDVMFRIGSLLLVLLTVGCGQDDPQRPPSPSPAAPPPVVEARPVPKFDRDSAYAYVAKQVGFGPRVPNTEAHRANKTWMAARLRDFGAEVIEQDFTATAFDGAELVSTNVIGRFYPDRTNRMALYAHWDTRPFADSELEDDPQAVVNGADDGASGVGVLLEIARQIGANDPGMGVDIVLLDAEDYGTSNNTNSWGLGAQYYARNLPPNKPRFGILLDMVGAADARFAQEQISMKANPDLMRRVWKLGRSMGNGAYFVNEPGSTAVDDHYFINTIAGIPTIDIINNPGGERAFVDHWHTGEDNLDKISKRTLKAVGQTVLAAIFREAAGTL